jgi:hypothetical protein
VVVIDALPTSNLIAEIKRLGEQYQSKWVAVEICNKKLTSRREFYKDKELEI